VDKVKQIFVEPNDRHFLITVLTEAGRIWTADRSHGKCEDGLIQIAWSELKLPPDCTHD